MSFPTTAKSTDRRDTLGLGVQGRWAENNTNMGLSPDDPNQPQSLKTHGAPALAQDPVSQWKTARSVTTQMPPRNSLAAEEKSHRRKEGGKGQNSEGSAKPPQPRPYPEQAPPEDPPSQPADADRLITRVLSIIGQKRRRSARDDGAELSSEPSLTPLTPARPSLPVNEQVLDALNSIRTTSFDNSFLSRLQGTTRPPTGPDAIYIDWETITPWMGLMADIRAHYALRNAAADSGGMIKPPPTAPIPRRAGAPITYTTLQPSHLSQIHDLLERVFWSGIDVSDSLDYFPEQSTVIATYKKLVVGVAILSSPQETYITYLAVRSGWDKAQIAKTMLYLLISRNPNKDITLHVSVNNSAMLLYNQFGFKAEEFVAGFYDDYLDPLSRASKNAFKLRLRQ